MSSSAESSFSWRPLLAEIVAELPKYQFENAKLVELMVRMKEARLLVSPYMDQDAEGNRFPLEEIDPFTFLAILHRKVTTNNRIALYKFLKNEWNLKSELPADFDGLPRVNMQKSWFMPRKHERKPHHVSTLWRLFIHASSAQSGSELDVELFDQCLALNQIGMTYLTMGLFWTKPQVWLSADKKNVKQVLELGVTVQPVDGSTYKQWLTEAKSKFTEPNWEFSHGSHVATLKDDKEETDELPDDDAGGLGAPFNRLFKNEDQANQVLDRCREVIDLLEVEVGDDRLVVSFVERGKSGGRMRVTFGRWVIFSYRNRKNDTSVQLLLPDDHPTVAELKRGYTFHDSEAGKKYALCWATWSWYEQHIEELQTVLDETIKSAKKCFDGWNASPYHNSHLAELYRTIMDQKFRTQVLRSGLAVRGGSDIDYWVFAPGEKAILWPECYARGFAAMGWDGLGDLNGYATYDEMLAEAESQYPGNSPHAVAGTLWNFSFSMKPGDVVFVKRGVRETCGWGVVAGDYYFDADREHYMHLLPVEWKSNVETKLPGLKLQPKTLTRMTDNQPFLDAMAAIYPDVPGLSEPEQEPILPAKLTYTKEDALRDLFMPEEKLERIVRLLKRKRNLVLQGPPGTGKTFVARRIAYLLMGEADQSRVPMVQFHQSTTYEDFVQGYRPNNTQGFDLKNGVFYEFCELARGQSDRAFVFVIDEINRGNLSKIFGELLMLIEHDKRGGEYAVPLSYATNIQDRFSVPPNLYIIGTMNTADRSLSMVDFALRRRFAFETLTPEFESPTFADWLKERGAIETLIADIRNRMSRLNAMILSDVDSLGSGYQIGHSFFVPIPGQAANRSWLDEVIECEIVPLLEEYWCDAPDELAKARSIARGEA